MDTLLGWGYFGIFIFLVLTGCGLPIPEEVPIVAAGCLASPQQHVLNPWIALVSCFFGAVVGDIVMYGIGRKFGRRLLENRAFFASYLTPEKEQHIEEMFGKHGLKVLFVSRFLVGIRSPIYITAGILKVPFRRFVLADLFCAGVMVTTFFALAYYFSKPVLEYIRGAEKAVTIAVVLLAIGAFIGYRYYRKRRAAHGAEHAGHAQGRDAQSDEVEEKSVA